MIDWPNTNPPPQSSSAAHFLLDRWRTACWEAATGHNDGAGFDAMERVIGQMQSALCAMLLLVAEKKSRL